jgi:hypothetical protein
MKPGEKAYYDHAITGHTVQTCPECRSGLAWDNEIGKHIPRVDLEFKNWNGVSETLLQMVKDAVHEKYGRKVSENNIVRLMGMAALEIRMIRKLLEYLKAASPIPAIEQDVKEYGDRLAVWESLVKTAKRKFGHLDTVRECVEPDGAFVSDSVCLHGSPVLPTVQA